MTTPTPVQHTPHNDSHAGRVLKYDVLEHDRQMEVAAQPVAPERPKDLYVKTYAPEHTVPFTKIVSTGTQPVDLLLPQDPTRRRAVVVTLDMPVVLCGTKELAQDPRNASNAAGLPAGGFVLPVNVPIVVESRGALWIAATNATATRVSVIVEHYDPDA